jgi:hypothetical protein
LLSASPQLAESIRAAKRFGVVPQASLAAWVTLFASAPPGEALAKRWIPELLLIWQF